MIPRLATVAFALSALVCLASSPAHAQDAGSATGASIGGCVETIPTGGSRPLVKDTFPDRGLSGYAATLVVVVEHGKGESVLPHGLQLESASEAAKALRQAGFVVPLQDGGAGARLTPNPPDPARPERASTTFELPLVVLPPSPGRQALVLPPLPVAVARASGNIMTACTRPHVITVEDPIASTPDAKPMPNPPPRPQREEWTALKTALVWIAIGAAILALLALMARRWMKRPKPVPAPPPPRPGWEIALEQLDEVRHAGLLEVNREDEYFDRVNDTLRMYLGSRYGFDGLESTTDEILAALEHAPLQGLSFGDVVDFLRECDLVKFANVTPTHDECMRALDAGEKIVRATMPRMAPAGMTRTPAGAKPPAPPPSPEARA
jgi:hypothetical protein